MLDPAVRLLELPQTVTHAVERRSRLIARSAMVNGLALIGALLFLVAFVLQVSQYFGSVIALLVAGAMAFALAGVALIRGRRIG